MPEQSDRIENDNAENDGQNGDLPDGEEYNGFYILNSKPLGSSPDELRQSLELALFTLSELFRKYPTLPADPTNACEHMEEAHDDTSALLLPRKHCAFKGCNWNGSDDMELLKHINERHLSALSPGIEAYRALKTVYSKDEAALALSIYNEGIAIAVRQGAPLASYSIDRRCMLQYNLHLNDQNTCALVCFVCARKFPRVHGVKSNPIKYYSLLSMKSTNDDVGGRDAKNRNKNDIVFLNDISRHKTEKMFGLKTYCDKYGKMNDKVTLSSDNGEFDDWHISIPFRSENTKILCCPEDMRCSSRDDASQRHADNGSCLDCEAPICEDCAACVYAADPTVPPAGLSNDMMIYYAPPMLYTDNVSVMEMICASVCITSMMSFTLEKKFRGSRSMDQKHNANKHRMAARGNATSFPLPWEDLLKQLQDGEEMAKLGKQASLPRTGTQLADVVSVLLKTAAGDDTERDVAKLIHQCNVRRDVVVKLIQTMQERGHRAYKHVNMAEVREKACALPENAVPPEIIRYLPLDELQDKIQMQKSATPVPIARDMKDVSAHLKALKPNAVVSEKSSGNDFDVNAQLVEAVQNLATSIRMERVEARTGNVMIDQFDPLYFSVAFSFIFTYQAGMPDMPAFAKHPRHRRDDSAPRIDTEEWVRIMSRRVEASVARDWTFGFVTWNYTFRSSVNLTRSLYAYERKDGKDLSQSCTPASLEKGALEIAKGLWGKYTDIGGNKKAVNGDMTKVRYVNGLSESAHILLKNIEHASRKLPGTQETRRIMRFQTQGFRIKYGTPLFITFSPDESHNVLMVRFSRTRRNDPVFFSTVAKDLKHACDKDTPKMIVKDGDVVLSVSAEELLEKLPDYDERRQILATDSLASVDGFRAMIQLTFQHLFGMNFCPKCPYCNHNNCDAPCQDLFGSNATAEGGILGRVDAVFTSIEAQKSTGSLHAHSQVFLQCLHQHTNIYQVLEKIREKPDAIVKEYLRYKAHVCRQVYTEDVDEVNTKLEEAESHWPEYKTNETLTSIPAYTFKSDCDLTDTTSGKDGVASWKSIVAEGAAWLKSYLHIDVEELQRLKQHHVHIVNEQTNEREPLAACRRKDNPKQCKSDFPRLSWLVSKPVILCEGLLKQMGLPIRGRRSKLGSMHGPMNNESINGTHPAMLATQRCNSDVQIPYRFPIDRSIHCCNREACLKKFDRDIIEAAQVAQDAQAGYACDYCTKRQPMAFNEVKECCKGHMTLAANIAREPINKQGKRHAIRLINDLNGKGIVRGQVENSNLRAYSKKGCVTAAEAIMTAFSEAFYGRNYVDVIEALQDKIINPNSTKLVEVDARSKRKGKITFRDVAVLYGQRPHDLRVWYLSPYEFVSDWEVKRLSYPTTIEAAADPRHHVDLTEAGIAKLVNHDPSRRPPELHPGIDYVVKDGGAHWLAFPDLPTTEQFRHTWIIQKRRRPHVPTFMGSPVPSKRNNASEFSALLTMAYFHPWTLREGEEEGDVVPYAGSLRTGENSWEAALKKWLDGNIISQESLRYVGNFLSVYRVRPRDPDDDARSDEDFDDEKLVVDETLLERAMRSRVGGRGGEDANDVKDMKAIITGKTSHEENSRTAMALAQKIWPERDVRNCKESISSEYDDAKVDEILAAAKASQRREKRGAPVIADADNAPALSVSYSASVEEVRAWCHRIGKKEVKGKKLLNDSQYAVVKKVVQRICEEMIDIEAGYVDTTKEPLRWVMHGSPGTGKTHVIKIIKEELFEKVLKWNMSMEYQIVALQAVMADLLQGDTIHHAFNIPVFGKNYSTAPAQHGSKKDIDNAKAVLQCRWIIIDEISMVSAKLLADIDTKLRSLARDVDPYAKDEKKNMRPFAGVNILCSGDFWQLPPPEGGFLGDIPCEYIKASRLFTPAPNIAHGQSLMWSGPRTGIQGVTELEICERTQDEWLKYVQHEFRIGKLSPESHAFLHGNPTMNPGSTVNGIARCLQDKCNKRISEAVTRLRFCEKFAKKTAEMECERCKADRASRILVAKDEHDSRFKEKRFLTSPAVFPTNDSKYDVNKKRSLNYAASQNTGIMYCIAQDKPSAQALRERPDLPERKLEFLNRHDRESGDLYGILPLMKGMPVAMTDHIDRSSDKRILRGTIGKVHSWVLAEDEQSTFENGKRILQSLPRVIFVKFKDKDGKELNWTLEGMSEPGLFPIVPVKRNWYLDKGRLHPVLRHTRTQLPLMPAFAMTAHAAQGQTFSDGAIVDLRLGGSSSAMASYVAITRVKRRQDLLIYRPFPQKLFENGQKPGLDLLMKVWRGEDINWARLEEEHMPKKYCPGCFIYKPKHDYHLCEWKKDDERGNCIQCIKIRIKDGAPYECNECLEWFCKEAFEEHQRDHKSTHTRVCIGCRETRTCIVCKEKKSYTHFTLAEWEHARYNDNQGKCRNCCERSAAGIWFCKGCQCRKPKIEFSQWIILNGEVQNKTVRCNVCKDKHEKELERIRKATHAMVITSTIQPSLNAHTHAPNQPSSDPEVEMVNPAAIQPPLNAPTHAPDQLSSEPKVSIYCCVCDNGKATDMNTFWHKQEKRHRFQNIYCTVCKKPYGLGRWLRRPHEADNTIEEWLKHNNAIAKNQDRPAHMTMDLYLNQNVKEERASKRQIARDAPTTATKRKKKE